MIEYIGNMIAYEFAFAVIFSPFMLLVVSLPDPKHPGIYRMIHTILFFAMVILYLCTGWLAHKATTRRVSYNQGFHEALMGAFSDARMYLSFLPLVGSLFIRDSKKSNGDITNTPIG